MTFMVTDDNKPKKFWLSFVDPDKPKGRRFLGVAIVEPTSEDYSDAALLALMLLHETPTTEQISVGAAIRCAHRLGVNPGGEVATWEMPEGVPEQGMPVGKLMSKTEVGRWFTKLGYTSIKEAHVNKPE